MEAGVGINTVQVVDGFWRWSTGSGSVLAVGNALATHANISSHLGVNGIHFHVKGIDPSLAAADCIVAAVSLSILFYFIYKLPKVCAAVVVAWIAWFIIKCCQSKEMDWPEWVEDHTSNALNKSRLAVKATAKAWVAWLHLLIPFAADAYTLLQPVVVGIGSAIGKYSAEAWRATDWAERGVATFVLLTLFIILQAVKKVREKKADIQKTAAKAGWQLVFLVLAPAVWFGCALVQQSCGQQYVLAGVYFMLTVLPWMVSFKAIFRVMVERREGERALAAQHAEAKKGEGRLGGWMHDLQDPSHNFLQEQMTPLPPALMARVECWLAYWSLWPVLDTAFILAPCVKDTGGTTDLHFMQFNRVLINVIIFCQFWNGSYAVPRVYNIFAFVIDNSFAKLEGVARYGKDIMSNFLWRNWGSAAGLATKGAGSFATVGAIILAVFVIKETFHLINICVILLIYWTVALDSARAVMIHHNFKNPVSTDKSVQGNVDTSRDERCVEKLCFWVNAVLWMWLCQLPTFGDYLSLWTVPVLCLALLAGEKLLQKFLLMIQVVIFEHLCRCLPSKQARRDSDARDTETPLLPPAAPPPAAPPSAAPPSDAPLGA